MCLDYEKKQIFTLGRYLDSSMRTVANLKVSTIFTLGRCLDSSMRTVANLKVSTIFTHIYIIIGFLINVQVQGHHPHQWAPFQVPG